MGAGGSTKTDIGKAAATAVSAATSSAGSAVAVGAVGGGKPSTGPVHHTPSSEPSKPSGAASGGPPKGSTVSTTSSSPDTCPEYWYHNKTPANESFDEMYYTQDKDIHSTFDEMFKASYVASATRDRPCPTGEHGKTPGGCACVKPGGDPGLPVQFRTRRVIRVEAADMWRNYVAKRNVIRSRRSGEALEQMDPAPLTESVVQSRSSMFAPLDPSVNELYAFHGTFVRYALSIAENDFNIDLAGSSTGTLYGRGAYLGESITKADEYAKDEPGGYYEGVFAVLVCRVTMGKMNVTASDPDAGDKVKRMEYDSTCGKRLFRELVIYYSDQCYPEYLVLYQRVHEKDIAEEIDKVLKRKFFMQVPLHWRNVATDLTKEHFRDHHEMSDPGYQHMQCLVNQARVEPGRKLQRVLRLEDSNLWERFVHFKVDLRERLGGDEGISAVTDDMGSRLKVNAVEKDLRALMKRPCKFFKSGCKRGDKCKFSHNEFAAALDDMGLAAGRRLPVDEMDRRLHEGFLWLACSTHDEAEEISSGNSPQHPELQGTCFYENLDAALKEVKSKDGLKYAILCRVLCGVPGDDPSEIDDKDCIILKVDEKNRRKVLIKESSAVYPEYFLELYSEEDEAAERGPAEAEEALPSNEMETPAIEPEEGERRAVEDTNDVPPDDDVPVDGGRNSGEVPPDSFVDIDDIPPESRVDIDEIPSDSHVDIESEEEHEEADGSREGDGRFWEGGPFWCIRRDDMGWMDGEPFDFREDALELAEAEADTEAFSIVVDKHFNVLQMWNKPKSKLKAKLKEMKEWWEHNKDDDDLYSSSGDSFF